MSEKPHHHRASLKQTNKSFKSKHATKSSLKDQAKGRTHRPSSISSSASSSKTGKTNANLSINQFKLNRKNHAKQIQLKKQQLLSESNLKLFQGPDKISRIVSIVPLSDDVDPLLIIEQLVGSLSSNSIEIQGTDQDGYRMIQVQQFHNQSIRFLLLPSASQSSSFFPILDASSVSDFIILALSSTIEVNTQAETLLRSITSTGISSLFAVTPELPKETKTLNSTTRLSLFSYLNHFFPTVEKVFDLSLHSESMSVIRGLCERVPKGVKWRESRTRLLAERIEFEQANDGQEGTLIVEGVVRGARLNVDRLVHLQGFGDFQLEKILAAPNLRKQRNKPSTSDSMDTERISLEELAVPSTSDADSLVSTNVPSSTSSIEEQTWPTEEEIQSAPIHHQKKSTSSRLGEEEMLPPARKGTTPRLRRVPKGTSAYQAAWIVDEDDDDDDQDDEDQMGEDEEMIDMDREENSTIREEEEEENGFEEETIETEGGFIDLSPEQEELQYAAYLKSKRIEDQDDLDFPDEIDTPLHIAARERFARFRGLKSFRTSAWDPYEELPKDYSRLFMFEDWKRMGNRIEKRAQLEGIEVGTRVILRIKNVPKRVYESYSPLRPFVIFGLLKHEHKYSVAHFTVTRNTEYVEPVRSKDALVLQLGPRRYLINPIFSAHTMRNGGKGTNNVHKFERYLRHGIDSHVATAYLPITFGNTPAVLLKLCPEQDRIDLVGTGSLLSCDPTRITAKRIILTGHPFKVHKKTATIRYMFFNRADVEYFKPVQLRTKRGRTGHIKEPLGTHGYFKAGFDGPLDQMDQVCMNLYKRCFPKWSSVYNSDIGSSIQNGQEREEEQQQQQIEIE